MDLTTCPACGGPAEVLWRESWPSTEGPVEHAKVGCVRRHWFLLPAGQLASAPEVPERQYRWSSTST
jgi:hypothetical protein